MAQVVVAVLLLLCNCEATRVHYANHTAAVHSLGRIVYLPNKDLDVDHNSDPLIFDVDHLGGIAKTERLNNADLNSKWFENSNEFRASIAGDMGIGGSDRAVELTVSNAFRELTGHEADVKAVELHATKIFSRTYLERGPQLYKIPLRKDFLHDFQSLPCEPQEPHTDVAWGPFQDFMNKWGSHIVYAAYTGSLFQSWSTASSTSNYKQWELEAKACLEAEGLKGTALGVCSRYGEILRQAVSTLRTVDTRRVKGGKAETRTKLATSNEVHEDLLQKFLGENEVDSQPVQYRYISVWDFLLGRSLQLENQDDVKRARALQAYYEGWRANTCPLVVTSGEANDKAQMFVAEYTTSNQRTGYYLCIRRCIGCHNYNYDCHWDILRACCRAYGPAALKSTGDGRDFVIRAPNVPSGWFGSENGCSWRPFGTEWSLKPVGCYCTHHNEEEGCNYDYPQNPESCNQNLKYKIIWNQHTLDTSQNPQSQVSKESTVIAVDIVTYQ